MNLLQPQDRRSRAPGDADETVAARARLAQARVDRALVETVLAWVDDAGLERGAGACDVGCGVGTLLGELAGEHELDAYGIDLAARAVDRAARRFPGVSWLVANADRGLPFCDASLSLVVSVKAPRPWPELVRVLGIGGHAVVVVPAVDDLAELRERTAGGALPRDPASVALAELPRGLRVVEQLVVRERHRLDASMLADLARVGYRGARRSEAARLEGLDGLTVTLASRVLVLARE